MSRLRGVARPANHGSESVLRARSLCGVRSGVEGQQILAVARDHFGIAVAASDLVIAHGIPLAGFGKAEEPVEMRPRRLFRLGRLGTACVAGFASPSASRARISASSNMPEPPLGLREAAAGLVMTQSILLFG